MSRTDLSCICSPESYSKMHKFILRECKNMNNQWIYKIIRPGHNRLEEDICIIEPEWVLVTNKHFGCEQRFLVIFRDEKLKTIRDLRQSHITVLKQIFMKVKEYLNQHNLFNYIFYFHYLPSVFQLHMHVNLVTFITKQNDRIQPLHTIIRNLEKKSTYYEEALILTKYCKTRHRCEILEKKTFNI